MPIPGAVSELVSYARDAMFMSDRYKGDIIDTITIHCYCSQVTAQRGVDYFANLPEDRWDDKPSCNYVVGSDCKIGQSVPENKRSHCTSNGENDSRAITIETASDGSHPYAVKPEVVETLINLVVDICKRHNIKKLVWSENKDDRVNHKNGCNMTVHRDYSSKSCPGQFLYERHAAIAAAVNSRLCPIIKNFNLGAVTATSIVCSFDVSENFNEYEWRYRLTTKGTSDIRTGSIIVDQEHIQLSLTGLKPSTRYELEIETKDTYDNIDTSPKVLVITAKDFPKNVTNVQLSVPSSLENILQISFTPTSDWGSSAYTSKGYLVSLIVDGCIIKELDSLIKSTDNSFNLLCLKSKSGWTFPAFSYTVPYESSFQIGIQPWTSKSASDIKLRCNIPPASTEPVYLEYFIKTVDKIFLKQNNSYDRVIFYGPRDI